VEDADDDGGRRRTRLGAEEVAEGTTGGGGGVEERGATGRGGSAGRAQGGGRGGRDIFEMVAVQKNEEEGDLRYKGGRRHRSWRQPPDTCQRRPGVGAKIYGADPKTPATSSCHVGMFGANVIGAALR
jgi:hypothetical protein